MNRTKLNILAIGAVTLYGLAACDGKIEEGHHDHAPGEHKDGDGHDDHDHADGEHKDGDGHDHEGHDHAGIVAGPNGGRVLTGVEPHAEFFVTEDRKVRITFVDDDLRPVAVGEQSVTVVAGDRAAPTNLAFEKSGDILVSNGVLPEGNDFPVVVQIKTDPSAKNVLERFNLNLNDCPTCENKEYACTCKHGE